MILSGDLIINLECTLIERVIWCGDLTNGIIFITLDFRVGILTGSVDLVTPAEKCAS